MLGELGVIVYPRNGAGAGRGLIPAGPHMGSRARQLEGVRLFKGACEMKREPKPYTTRKRPESTVSHAAIQDWIRRAMPGLQPILKQLDDSILGSIPGVEHALKWKRAFYGLPETGWIIEIVPYDVSVNVIFLGGAEFESPPPLGSTDRSRYAKVTTLQEAQGPEMHKWIEQARRVKGWK